MSKIAIYDFCKTIVDFESGDEFIHYIRRSTGDGMMKIKNLARIILRETGLLRVIEKIGNTRKCSVNKQLVLNQIKGFSKEIIDSFAVKYYESVIKYHFVTQILEQIKEQKRQGYIIVVVSASYYPFLKLFQEEYGIDYLITNKFEYKDGYFTGQICRDDCIGINKVKYFKEQFPNFNCSDFESCLSYGDSVSDKYILGIAKEGYVVSIGNRKEWVKNTTFKEIII